MFMPNDRVTYVGEKYRKELNGKVGFVIAKVEGTESGLVVEFGDDSYVMPELSLSRFRPAPGKDEPEVHRIRKRYDEDEA